MTSTGIGSSRRQRYSRQGARRSLPWALSGNGRPPTRLHSHAAQWPRRCSTSESAMAGPRGSPRNDLAADRRNSKLSPLFLRHRGDGRLVQPHELDHLEGPIEAGEPMLIRPAPDRDVRLKGLRPGDFVRDSERDLAERWLAHRTLAGKSAAARGLACAEAQYQTASESA